ncbi:MAG TPA: GTPase ObgE [Phycisphaerae bacterium]|nr:GTPase ObgE [Phycisphaerae bacterium]HRW55182.1 GTPase ObgE [Phycisphaerae bacterium]
MKFIDEAIICVRSGKGGDGCVSFRREKYVPKGGPDGGDGGDGGSVIIVADGNMATLVDFTGHHHWTAENGRPGEGANRSGKKGLDEIVRVPTGTLVFDRDSGALLRDLNLDCDEVCVARGGRGGRGNTRFATATHQTPREFDPGEPGEERWLRLELKLIADVGVVGLPNAGKSTFLSRVSRAKPKIANYPFTTLVPNLGIVDLPGFRRYVVADVPGLIEGAHEGAGLGDQFLRHVERTRVLMHLVDLYPMEGSPTPEEAYRTIRRELEQYSPKLASKPEIVVANKLDLAGNDNPPELAAFGEAIGARVVGISAVSGRGVERVANLLWDMLEAAGDRPTLSDDDDD